MMNPGWTIQWGRGLDQQGQAIAIRLFSSLLLVLTAFSASLAGGWASVASAEQLAWTPLLSSSDLTVTTIASDPGQPNRLYVGVRSHNWEQHPGSFFRSDDGGATWTRRRPAWPTEADEITHLAVDPVNPQTLYASVTSVGLLKSIDGGATWAVRNTGLPKVRWAGIKHIAIDPANPQTLYIANLTDGVFKSTDGADTWKKPSVTDEFSDFDRVAVAPSSPGVVFAAGLYGAYKSEDAGATWRKLGGPTTRGGIIAISPTDPRVIYLAVKSRWLTEQQELRGVWRSTDGGASWLQVDPTPDMVTAMLIDPHDPNTIFVAGRVGTNFGVRWSRDGGTTWASLGHPNPQADPGSQMLDTLALVNNRLLVGAAGGIWQLPFEGRYFPQTGFRIDNDAIWAYFNRRGGEQTFGYPVSRTFTLQGFTTQIFQRRVVQLDEKGLPRLVNLLDSGLMPYTTINGATLPGIDSALVASAPDPTDAVATLNFVKDHTPDNFNGKPVNFYRTFLNTVSLAVAYPGLNVAPYVQPGLNLEMWGIPTNGPMVDPNNADFIYLRFQRGIMHYDAGCNCTQGILLAEYLKRILTGTDLPPDLDSQAQTSPYYKQYDPGAPNWVRNPALLPNTDLTNTFTRQ